MAQCRRLTVRREARFMGSVPSEVVSEAKVVRRGGYPHGAPVGDAGWAGMGGEGVGSRRFSWWEGLCAD